MRTIYWVASLVTAVYCIGMLTLDRGGVPPPPSDPRVLPASAVDTTVTYSNILPDDYVGPETCAACHDEQYRLWKTHPHHCMNRLPTAESVKGDFDEVELLLPTGKILFSTEQSKFLMTVFKEGHVHRRYEATRTVGSRYMQSYIGRQLEGPEPADHAIYDEHMLPFSYWFKVKRWFPREYLNIFGPEKLANGVPQSEAIDHSPDVQSYTAVCMNCHNTFAYAYRIFQDHLCGFPHATVAAAIEPLSQALLPDVEVQPTVESFSRINESLNPDTDLVTQGISCESCHFGGREHALYEKQIRFLPTSQYTRVVAKDPYRLLNSDRGNATTINGVCVQCHSGNGELLPNGAGKGNSREALDMHAGFCNSQLRCVDCHEPHTGTPYPSGFVDRPAHIQLCTSCHSQFDDPQAALAHSGHPSHSDVNCLDCHMPRYTRGIDELIRTHRICMPVEQSMVKEGMANACNLCHLDKSMQWTLDQLQQRWGKSIKPHTNWPAFNKLRQPAGKVWLKSDDSHTRLVATQSLARSPLGRDKLPELIRSLNDSERINRVFAGFAVSRMLDQPLDQPLRVDILAAPADRLKQINNWLNDGVAPQPKQPGYSQ